MLYEIKSWSNGNLLYSAESDSLLKCVELAVTHGANLDGATLDGANLDGATLDGATLDGATLDGATLDGATRLETGERWEQYLKDVVPQLLVAGGQSLSSFAEHWTCYSWDNCPMAHAFRCTSEEDTPLLLRPRVRQFVQLFDARLIPSTVLETK